jgi:hypothetical protein
LRRIPLAPNPACAESRSRRIPLAPNPARAESRSRRQEGQYDPNDETHREFVIATANLFAHMLGVHPLKNGLTKPGEPRWQAQYREAAWLASVVSTLPPPAYVKGKVSRWHSFRRVCIGTDY